MSEYVEKHVIRYKPTKEEWKTLELLMKDEYQNKGWGLDGDFVKDEYKKFFRTTYIQKSGYFESSPTVESFLDFVFYLNDDSYGDFGNVRRLTDREFPLALQLFRKLIPTIPDNSDDFRYVEYCWYNCSEAPDYFDVVSNDDVGLSGEIAKYVYSLI